MLRTVTIDGPMFFMSLCEMVLICYAREAEKKKQAVFSAFIGSGHIYYSKYYKLFRGRFIECINSITGTTLLYCHAGLCCLRNGYERKNRSVLYGLVLSAHGGYCAECNADYRRDADQQSDHIHCSVLYAVYVCCSVYVLFC